MEGYLEVIYELIKQKGYATTVDISNYLNVSSPSVTKNKKRLGESGYLNYEKYEHHLHHGKTKNWRNL